MRGTGSEKERALVAVLSKEDARAKLGDFIKRDEVQKALSAVAINYLHIQKIQLTEQNLRRAFVVLAQPLIDYAKTGQELVHVRQAQRQIAEFFKKRDEEIRDVRIVIRKLNQRSGPRNVWLIEDLAIPQKFVAEAKREGDNYVFSPNLPQTEALLDLYKQRLTDVPILAKDLLQGFGVEIMEKARLSEIGFTATLIRGFVVGSLVRFLGFDKQLDLPVLSPDVPYFLKDIAQRSRTDNVLQSRIGQFVVDFVYGLESPIETNLPRETVEAIVRDYIDYTINTTLRWLSRPATLTGKKSSIEYWEALTETFAAYPLLSVYETAPVLDPASIAMAIETGRWTLWTNGAVRISDSEAIPDHRALDTVLKKLKSGERPEVFYHLIKKLNAGYTAWVGYIKTQGNPETVKRLEKEKDQLKRSLKNSPELTEGEKVPHPIFIDTQILLLTAKVSAATRLINHFTEVVNADNRLRTRLESLNRRFGPEWDLTSARHNTEFMREEMQVELDGVSQKIEGLRKYLKLPHLVHLPSWLAERVPVLPENAEGLKELFKKTDALIAEFSKGRTPLPSSFRELTKGDLNDFFVWVYKGSKEAHEQRRNKTQERIKQIMLFLSDESQSEAGYIGRTRELVKAELTYWRNELDDLTSLMEKKEDLEESIKQIGSIERGLYLTGSVAERGVLIDAFMERVSLELLPASVKKALMEPHDTAIRREYEEARVLVQNFLKFHGRFTQFKIPAPGNFEREISAEIGKRRKDNKYGHQNATIRFLGRLRNLKRKDNPFLPEVASAKGQIAIHSYMNGLTARVWVAKAILELDEAVKKREELKGELKDTIEFAKKIKAITEIMQRAVRISVLRSEYDGAEAMLRDVMRKNGFVATRSQMKTLWLDSIALGEVKAKIHTENDQYRVRER